MESTLQRKKTVFDSGFHGKRRVKGAFDFLDREDSKIGNKVQAKRTVFWGGWEQGKSLSSVLDYVVFEVLVGHLIQEFPGLEPFEPSFP